MKVVRPSKRSRALRLVPPEQSRPGPPRTDIIAILCARNINQPKLIQVSDHRRTKGAQSWKSNSW
jgi:hypothetical protein